MDYIYGIISQKAEQINYIGSETASAKTEIDGKTIKVTVTRPIPAPGTDSLKVLVSDAQQVKWREYVPLPEFTVADAGKVLGISSEGSLQWVNPNLT